ncbi:MAG: hypothetical protein IKP08_00500 [Bacteroidales bacterium]|nr:hypothetical protein [Bacteroidales bacterium]
MLISICQDVIEKGIDVNDNDHQYAIEALKMLLMAVKWNKHIVCVLDLDEKDIRNFTNILSKEEIKLLEFIHSKRQRSRDLLNKLYIYTKITFQEETKKTGNVIVYNPRTHTDFELYEETHFIVENILDAQYYSQVVCKYCSVSNRLNHISLKYYPVQGGGATISDVIRNELKLKQHFCIIVCDSDKKFEGAEEEGDTAKGVKNIFSNLKNEETDFHFDFYVMSKVREIENLIPFCVLEQYDKSKKDFISQYKNHLSFYDMKIGLDYKILFDKEIYDEWKTVFKDKINWKKIDLYKKITHSREEFNEKIKELPAWNICWGKNLLKNVLNPKLKGNKNDKQYKLYDIKCGDLTNNQQYEWDEIGKRVISWCCCFANPPR